jgi:hypothetical protein
MARRRSTKRTEGGRKRRRTMRGGTIATSFSVGAGDQNVVGAPGGIVGGVNLSGPVPGGYPSATDGGNPQPFQHPNTYAAVGAGRRRRKTKKVVKKKSVKAIKRLLKAKGLKVSGSRRALTLRARKARIPMKGGNRSPLSGAPYQESRGGEGNVDRGRVGAFNRAHEVNNNVLPLPGYGGGSSEFVTTATGGLRHE